jgi:hypothetical protein
MEEKLQDDTKLQQTEQKTTDNKTELLLEMQVGQH